MKNVKSKHSVWMDDSIWKLVHTHYQADKCTTHNEFIEKAIRFYVAYRNAQEDTRFVPEAILSVLGGTLNDFAERIGSHLFKLTVEQNVCNHILATDSDIDYKTYQAMRGKSIREVMSTHGRIGFEDAIQDEKGV